MVNQILRPKQEINCWYAAHLASYKPKPNRGEKFPGGMDLLLLVKTLNPTNIGETYGYSYNKTPH